MNYLYRRVYFHVFLGILLWMSFPIFAQGFLWQAQRGTTTLFLLGSVHVCDAGCYPFSPSIQQALLASNAIAVELDEQRADIGPEIEKRGFYSAGTSLRQWLSSEQVERLSRVMAQQYGKPVEPLLRMRPWLFQTVISIFAAEQVGLQPDLGVDLRLTELARGQKKPVLELETLDEQLEALEMVGESEISTNLIQMIDMLENTTLGIYQSNLVVAWKKGDIQRMQVQLNALLTEHEKKEAFIQSMKQRNQRITEHIVQYTQQYPVLFVVVGAAHFFGTDNILDLLKQQGFDLRRLPSSKTVSQKK